MKGTPAEDDASICSVGTAHRNYRIKAGKYLETTVLYIAFKTHEKPAAYWGIAGWELHDVWKIFGGHDNERRNSTRAT